VVDDSHGRASQDAEKHVQRHPTFGYKLVCNNLMLDVLPPDLYFPFINWFSSSYIPVLQLKLEISF
jgi:hypothetical protein